MGDAQHNTFLIALRTEPQLFLRLPYLAFGALFVLAAVGGWVTRKKVPETMQLVFATLVICFILYCGLSFGWYRLILPGHLLLLAFVPAGAVALLGKRNGALLLFCIALVQGYWLLDHRGSSTSLDGLNAAAYIQEHYANKDMIIEQTEVYARLPENPHWYFLMPNLSFSLPKEYNSIDGKWCSMPFLLLLNPEQKTLVQSHITATIGDYSVVSPPYPCPPFPHE